MKHLLLVCVMILCLIPLSALEEEATPEVPDSNIQVINLDWFTAFTSEPDSYYFVDDLIVQDRIVCIHLGQANSGTFIVDYSYEIIERELKLTFYERMIFAYADIDRGRNGWFVIPVPRDQYDTISVNGDSSNFIIFADGQNTSYVDGNGSLY